MKTLPSTSEMVKAYRGSDASYDGVFYLAVKTTGVFCVPSCPARSPRPQNVEYFATPQDALWAGYRPCLRCRPTDMPGRPPGWVESLLQRIEQDPAVRISDADLRAMSIEPARARRYFKKHYGMTFQAYHRARRMGQALTTIRNGDDLIRVGLDHGFESNSGFRDAFQRTFGRSPGRSRKAECLVTQLWPSPLGPLLVCASSKAVCLLEFTDRRALDTQVTTLQKIFDRAVVPGTNEHLEQLKKELALYFAGRLRKFCVPLDYPGTPFQQAVWKQLRRIPYGRTISYEELADRVGHPGAQRAVGTTNGKNRIAIVIPCHRVVNKSGKLGGYGGGLWAKQLLLDLERRTASPQSHKDTKNDQS